MSDVVSFQLIPDWAVFTAGVVGVLLITVGMMIAAVAIAWRIQGRKKEKRYIYIQAVVSVKARDPGDIRFRHTFVNAKTDEDAYLKGQRWFDISPIDVKREMCNDYVIRFPVPRRERRIESRR